MRYKTTSFVLRAKTATFISHKTRALLYWLYLKVSIPHTKRNNQTAPMASPVWHICFRISESWPVVFRRLIYGRIYSGNPIRNRIRSLTTDGARVWKKQVLNRWTIHTRTYVHAIVRAQTIGVPFHYSVCFILSRWDA